MVEAAQRVAAETGVDIRPGLDLAASEFYRDGKYVYRDRSLTPAEQVDFIVSLIELGVGTCPVVARIPFLERTCKFTIGISVLRTFLRE